jgi:hypothetical protein
MNVSSCRLPQRSWKCSQRRSGNISNDLDQQTRRAEHASEEEECVESASADVRIDAEPVQETRYAMTLPNEPRDAEEKRLTGAASVGTPLVRDQEEKRQRPDLSIITKTQQCADQEQLRVDAGRR